MKRVIALSFLCCLWLGMSSFEIKNKDKTKKAKTEKNLEKWRMDPDHSSIGFTATHLLISEVEGKFKDFEVTVDVNRDDFVDSKFKVLIQTNSVDTDSRTRDNHLKSEDFLNVDKFPTMEFESTMFKWDGTKRFKMKGYLTLNGVKHLEEFEVKYGGSIIDPIDGKEKAGFKIRGEINRYDYGLKWNIAEAAENFAVGEMVEIECNLRLIREPSTEIN